MLYEISIVLFQNLVCCAADVLEGRGLVQVAITVAELMRFHTPRSPAHSVNNAWGALSCHRLLYLFLFLLCTINMLFSLFYFRCTFLMLRTWTLGWCNLAIWCKSLSCWGCECVCHIVFINSLVKVIGTLCLPWDGCSYSMEKTKVLKDHSWCNL